jgi:hypothetical protein
MTKREVKKKMYRSCKNVGYLHIKDIDDQEQRKSRHKRGMSKAEFRRKLMEAKNGD